MFTWEETEKNGPYKVLNHFETYVRPRKNKRIARHRLQQRKRNSEETLDHFVKDLRIILMDCENADPEDILTDVIIDGIFESRVQERLLDQGEGLSRAKVLEIGQQFEMSHKQIRFMRNEDNYKLGVSAITAQSKSHPKPCASSSQLQAFKACGRCGKDERHLWNQGKCPAVGSACSYCKRPNHWMLVCRR